MIVNVKRKRNTKTEQQEIIARKIKRNAIKKRYIKDVKRLATSVVVWGILLEQEHARANLLKLRI